MLTILPEKLDAYIKAPKMQNSRAKKKWSRFDIKLCIARLHDCGLKEIVRRYQIFLFILVAMEESLESRMKLIISLLAVLLFVNKDERTARPNRRNMNGNNDYLVHNDEAFYNINRMFFTKVKSGQAKPPRDILLRQPTDVELTKIATKIGEEYVLLALLLGITRAELDHIREDNSTAVRRIFYMLLKWKESKESNATIEKLANALEELGYNADIVYSSLDEA